MKKMYKYILIITIVMFSFIGEVRARDDDGVNSCVKDKKCSHICSYEFKNKKNKDYKVNIYNYITGTPLDGYYYSVGNGTLMKFDQFSYKPYNDSAYETLRNEKKCPQNLYFDEDVVDEACFDDNGTYCEGVSSKFKKVSSVKIINNFETIKEETGLDVYSTTEVDKCVLDGKCKFLCKYSSQNSNYKANIYYFPNQTIQNRYKVSASWVKDGELQNISFPNVYSSEAYIIESDLLKLMDEGICPQNMYRDPDGKKEVCFDNSGGCISKSKFKDHEIEDVDITPTTKIADYLKEVKEDRKNELSCESAKEKIASNSDLENITEICGYTRINPGDNEVRQFFVVTNNNEFKFYRYTLDGDISSGAIGYIDEVKNVKEKNNISFNDAYTCKSFNHFYTSAAGNNPQWRIDEDAFKDDNMYMFTCSFGSPMGYDKVKNEITDCKSLLGDDLRNEINSWFLYIKIAVPIILIVMGSLDFGKAFISSDEDAMKKAQKKFIMRLIIAIVIFFIPAIVNALLNIGDQVWNISNGNGTCEIKF